MSTRGRVSTITRRFVTDDSGQTLAEYALILMLVALLTIAALTTIGTSISDFLADAANGIGGG